MRQVVIALELFGISGKSLRILDVLGKSLDTSIEKQLLMRFSPVLACIPRGIQAKREKSPGTIGVRAFLF
jgi:hypothetical protein